MSLETIAHIVQELAHRGYNAEREAVTLLAGAPDPERAIERAVEMADDDAVVLSAAHVRESLEEPLQSTGTARNDGLEPDPKRLQSSPEDDPSISTGARPTKTHEDDGQSPVETKGSDGRTAGSNRTENRAENQTESQVENQTEKRRENRAESRTGQVAETGVVQEESVGRTRRNRAADRDVEVSGDIQSTGTGEYRDFVSVFRDRYEKLAAKLRGRVNHRPTAAVADMTDGSETAIIGMVADIGSTKNGHWRLELEDTSGTFPCLILKDRDFAVDARELLTDEVIAVEGTVASGGGDAILFVDDLYFPDVPRTNSRSSADRPVEAVLISDVHVGSQEFLADAWGRFTDWLHTPEAERVEYLLIAGDMVEGIGVYPNQDEELDIIDIYDQYEAFSEHLKEVPGDLDIVMIPGNHDAVRLAEPQPAFDEELRDIMSAHDATISANPSTVTIEGVTVLMYHGTSFDEVIAQLPEEKASYERPQDTMACLLRKRHLAPKYGGLTRIAPEKEDHLVIEEVPDIFHTGHIHKLGYGTYHDVLTINSSCWQAQTDFQKSVNLDPDVGYVPIVRLDTFDLTIRQFA